MSKKQTFDLSTGDSFTNFLAKLGANTQNLQSYSQYSLSPFVTRNRIDLEAAYRSSWLVGQVVDTVAEDMTREGVTINSELPPDDIKLIQSTFIDLAIWHEISNTIKWARLYGGAIAVILTEGADYEKPLNINAVGKGRFKGLVVFDRWMLDPSFGDLVTEIGPSMGKPKYYRILPGMPALSGQRVHYSRIIRFDGIELPYYQRLTENLWGLSVVERMYDRLVAFDSATQGASQLLHKAHLRTIQVKGFREALALGGATESAVVKQFNYIRLLQTLEGLTVLDGDDKFEVHPYSFSGISDVLMQFGEQISGATGIPLVRLFGQSPAGLSSSGESDLRNYYDHINKLQESQMRAALVKLFDVVGRSVLGKSLPKGFEFEFNSLWQLSDTEKGQIASTDATTIASAYGAGLITKKIGMKELLQGSRVTGRFTNITEEDIENVKEEVPAGEENPFGSPPKGSESPGSPLPLSDEENEKTIEDLKNDLEALDIEGGDDNSLEGLKKKLEKIDVDREIVDKPSAADGVKRFFKDGIGKILKPLIGLALVYSWFRRDKKQISTEERANRLLGLSPFSPGQDSIEKPTRKEVLESIQKELKNIRSTFDAHLRAPKGGVSIKGKEFKGGEFIPSEGGYAEEYEKMQKEGKSGSSEEPKEEKSPEKKTDKKEKEEKPKKEKKPTINYPEPKRSKMEASFIGTKRLPPTKVLNKKGEEVEKAGALVMANGKPLPKHVAHIAIPPAWQHVRINPDPNGEALVAGTDQRGRRQVKYSEAHDGRVATIKFGKVRKFEANIDRVIKNIERNYKGDKKEQALCLRLIEQTGARADTGNNEGEVKTYGASSLQNKHIKVNDDGSVAVEFIGKHGKPNYYKVNDPALSKILKERAKRPDKEQNVFDTDYRKLKKFSKEVSNNTPKAFRTRVGTNRAKEAVAKMPMPKTEKELMKARLTVAEAVSKYLCNTRKVCLEKYIDPIVFKAWKIKGE
jgi:phage-related protein (TIGR01555 family)